jgi:hypothetical protein
MVPRMLEVMVGVVRMSADDDGFAAVGSDRDGSVVNDDDG